MDDMGKIADNQNDASAACDDAYEYCPNCQANLTLQKGYDPTLAYWQCKGCGQMLINPEVDSDIVWICDECGATMNTQEGFSESCGEWKCTKCGYVNKIDASEIYASEDEFQAEKRNPYRGLSDEDALKLSMYQEEETIEGRGDIILVRHRETGKRYIKKMLTFYNKSVYSYLVEHPIERMPRIIDLFESSNCLIVIEEFVVGQNLEHILEKGPLSQEKAIIVALNICDILNELHNLPTPIIHRDVKPSNIIITIDGEVNLLDMNVAKWFDPEQSDDTWYLGTQYYAAPEQAGYGLAASSAKSDIYALGMLLNVMITGSFPKEKRAPGEIWNIIERCISLSADDRYTAKELREALEKLRGRSVAE